jgi:hypothetical protein
MGFSPQTYNLSGTLKNEIILKYKYTVPFTSEYMYQKDVFCHAVV